MDLISKINKVKARQEQLDIQESFNIYNLLRARYVSLQTVQLFTNFVHDIDWEVLLDRFKKHFMKQIDVLEKLGEKFRIIMPGRPPLDIKFATRINDITDDYIYRKIYHDMVAQLMSLTNAVRSSSTNDNLRSLVIDDLTVHFEDFDALYKFGKTKGWEEAYPVYKTSLPQQEEPLSTSEAFHIWDHISLRYEQIELIGLFLNFAHDTEFKVILQHGLHIFNKQVGHLEQLALKLNVPLPNRPTQLEKTPIDPETIKDKFMYRNILSWELTSLENHIRAIIETIRNDALRKLWTDLLNTELDFYDKYLKYGKMKGWIRPVPMYGEPAT
jgi:spore coat protein CotF